jgi:hypothetical protein
MLLDGPPRLSMWVYLFMKYFLILSSSILLVNGFSCGKAVQGPRQERSEFASRIGSILPQGWTLQEGGGEVIISRQEPVTWYPCVALDVSLMRREDLFKEFVEKNGRSSDYRIRLRRAARLEPAEYARIKASNDQIVVNKSTMIPKREFFEDEAMRSFDSRYRELPEYYDDSSSIYVETTAGPYDCIYPNSVAKECDDIRERLDSLFSRYSKDSYRKTLTHGIW